MTLQLTITMNEAGQVSVSGPIEQKLLCYGLLVIAKDVIAAHQPLEQRIVVPAPGALAVRGNGHG